MRPKLAAMSNQHAHPKPWLAILCGAFLAAGCTTVPNPAYCGDRFCHDPSRPFCDVDGTIGGGTPLTCIAVECTPLEFEACRGDEAIVCNATGDDYDITHCEAGCSAETGGCKPTHIIPKYLPAVCDQLATEPELTISESTSLDTSVDGTCNGGLIEQSTEGIYRPKICVLHYGTIRIATNKTLSVIGYHAIALVADRALSIDGVLDVSANGTVSGPGGNLIVSTQASATWPAAPGGAGFKTAGGPGGNAYADGGAANGGAATMDPALIVNLIGGAIVKSSLFDINATGGGGGAATLISCRDTISVEGLIDAGGGGGGGGKAIGGASLMPNGGGSGGYVVLQGMAVSVTGQMYANGGGGGAGSSIDMITAASGEDGTRSDTVSARGGGSENGEGAGGAGGRAGADPGPGKKPITSGFGAGAGGGSTGFFQTYTPAGVTPTLTPVAASPAFQPNRTVEMR